MKSHPYRLPRLTNWLIVNALLLVFLGLFFPQQIPVSLYKLSLVAMAGVVGYWLDRSLFPYARPDRLNNPQFALLFGLAMLRRALIVGCAMLAMGLGA